LVVDGAVGGCLASKENKEHHLAITTRHWIWSHLCSSIRDKALWWRDVNGTLTTYGLNLDASTVVVTGSPTQATSASSVTVTTDVTDANNITADKTFALII